MKSRTYPLLFSVLLVADLRSKYGAASTPAKERSPRPKARGAAIEHAKHILNLHKKKTAYSYST